MNGHKHYEAHCGQIDLMVGNYTTDNAASYAYYYYCCTAAMMHTRVAMTTIATNMPSKRSKLKRST